MFQYNVQHDCRQAKCVASGRRAIIQEHVQSEVSEPNCFIEHKPLDRFLINTHAFHNAHLICAALPQNLTIPIAYSEDCVAHYASIEATECRQEEKGYYGTVRVSPVALQLGSEMDPYRRDLTNILHSYLVSDSFGPVLGARA